MSNDLNQTGGSGAPVPPAGSGYFQQTAYDALQPTQPQPGVTPGQAGLQATQPVTAGAREQAGAQQAAQQGWTTVKPAGAQPQAAAWTAQPQAAAAQPATKEAKRGGGAKTFLAGFGGAACACLLAGGLWLGTGGFGTTGTTTVETPAGTQVVLGSAESSSVVASNPASGDLAETVAAKTLPSVVAIDTYVDASNYYYGWGFGSSSSDDDSLTAYGTGSGVIVSQDGYILTNNHVIEDAEKIVVTANGQEYDAEVVGTDPSSDVAVIKVDAEGLDAIEIGTSSNLRAGQWVMTVGSPFGLEQSVATGIISSTSRTVTVSNSSSSYYSDSSDVSIYPGMIQTDALINPGNSGGALVDENGRLIGINSVINSYSGDYAGVGFAIPIDYAMNIATQIIEGQTPTHAQLGVSVVSLDSSTAKRYGVDVSAGAYVNYVYDGSGAAEAGIEQGDVIVKVGDTKIESSVDLIAAVRLVGVGETAQVTYVRDGVEQTADVTLGSDEDINATDLRGQQYSDENPYTDENGRSYDYEDLLELLLNGGGFGQDGDRDRGESWPF